MNGAAPLIDAIHVSKSFVVDSSPLRRLRGLPPLQLHAVRDLSLQVARGETVGLVGESGCGKTTFGRCLVRLYRPSSGQILHNGVDIFSPAGERSARGSIQMIFQDPYSSLNPRLTVRQTIGEVLRVKRGLAGGAVATRVAELLNQVGLAPELADRFPNQLSGGQRQRVGIARALAVEPDVIVCDEAVSALDVSVQAQVLNLLMRLQDELGLTYLFIAHNLGVVRHISKRVAVMYLGRLVEQSDVEDLFREPLHPYSRALLQAMPVLDTRRRSLDDAVAGDLPSPIAPPPGCPFHPRCPHAMPRCREETPALLPAPAGRTVACFLYHR
ncbi:MAG TPA: ABC transporter ATP-binding protein [Chloroflexota bacterium]|nr:ABC transporter ATP-binding protein [Chloroflexota bacterium]